MKIFDVFISYSSRQKNIADAICHVLEEHNIKCWIAPRDIPVGEKYAAVITRAIKESKLVVLVFSELSAVSPWVESEINIAFSNRKPILPYKVDNANLNDYDEFYLMLNNRHWIESVPDFRSRFNELLETVAHSLNITITKTIRKFIIFWRVKAFSNWMAKSIRSNRECRFSSNPAVDIVQSEI